MLPMWVAFRTIEGHYLSARGREVVIARHDPGLHETFQIDPMGDAGPIALSVAHLHLCGGGGTVRLQSISRQSDRAWFIEPFDDRTVALRNFRHEYLRVERGHVSMRRDFSPWSLLTPSPPFDPYLILCAQRHPDRRSLHG